jgi:hypothetical protein
MEIPCPTEKKDSFSTYFFPPDTDVPLKFDPTPDMSYGGSIADRPGGRHPMFDLRIGAACRGVGLGRRAAGRC